MESSLQQILILLVLGAIAIFGGAPLEGVVPTLGLLIAVLVVMGLMRKD